MIGAGLIAQVMHLHYLRELADRFEISAICDIAPENAAASAERYGVAKVCTDWRDLLREPIDAILVLTAGSHAPMAIEAARAGVHVLVEKPMCFSTREGAAMVDAAERANVTLMVAYNKRHDPAYVRFQDEAAAMSDARFLRVTTLESPIQPYVSHYPLAPIGRPPPAELERLRAETAASITAAIGAADEFHRKAYHAVLLDTLVHEINAVRGLLGEPDRLDYVDLREGSLTAMLRFGDLALDMATREATRGARLIELTTKEFELLALFMRHPRRVLTRNAIMEQIWGYDFDGESNVIEVYVGHLRQKVEAAGEPRLIHTVRHAGYVLRE